MNIRILVLFAALLPFIVYVAGVFGELPPCTERTVPKFILCPAQPSYDCSDGAMMYTYQKQWLIKDDSRDDDTGVFVASHEGEVNGYGISFEADMIVETGATCGGRSIRPSPGWFGTQRVDNNDAFVTPGINDECYREFDCDWIRDGSLKGYVWITMNGTQKAVEGSQAQWRCEISGEASTAPWPDITVVPATWGDCFGGE